MGRDMRANAVLPGPSVGDRVHAYPVEPQAPSPVRERGPVAVDGRRSVDAAPGRGKARGRLAFALLATLSLAVPAHAVQPDEVLKDPVLEHRAREISSELRCLVCQNQSIDDSDAPLAKDLRVIVRERLQKGDSDPAVLRYIVDRYGEFVLLRPVFALHTLLLWLTPILAVLLGAFGIWRLARRRPAAPVRTLSAAEQAEVAALLRRE